MPEVIRRAPLRFMIRSARGVPRAFFSMVHVQMRVIGAPSPRFQDR
jgi:hypothetical protein